jgi:TatD DNase family protein
MVTFYDTHAHLDYPDFKNDFDQVIARAEAAGIGRIISIGTTLASSERAIRLAERFPPIYAAIGCHPTEAHTTTGDLRPELRRLAAHPKVVAIGEIGLDYYRLPSAYPDENPGISDTAYKQRQAEVFQQQLEVAAESSLNCIIHQRASFDDTLAQIKPLAAKTRGVFHCFGESVDRMQQIFSLGWLVSFTGIVTFKNAQNVRDAVTAAPLGKFMLETDCPYLAPVPYRGKRCEPAYVKEISETVAQVKGCTLAELGQATCQTAHDFFPKLK